LFLIQYNTMICTQLFILNTIAIITGLYMMVTLPFVIDSITRIKNVDDDYVKDREFRKNYRIPLNNNNTHTDRQFRGLSAGRLENESSDDYEDNEKYTEFTSDDIRMVYVIVDNIQQNIIYSIIQNYCVIIPEEPTERRDM